MSSRIVISSKGVLSCGSNFVDTLSTQPPVTFQYVSKDSTGRPVSPDLTTFTTFGTARSVRTKQADNGKSNMKKRKPAKEFQEGGHAALYYRQSNSFFSILVARCDSWAVHWAVGNFSANCEVVELHALNAHLVAGICVSGGSKRSLFVASRYDTPLAKREDNRLWRQFVAEPRIIESKFDGEIITMTPAGPSSFVVLTSTGALSLVTVDLEVLAKGGDNDASVSQKQLLAKAVSATPSASTKMVFRLADEDTVEEEKSTLAIFAAGQSFLVLAFFAGSLEESGVRTAVKKIDVAAKSEVSGMQFCGSRFLSLFLSGSSSAVQFVTLTPSSDTAIFDTAVSEHVSLKYCPVACTFNSRKKTQSVICSASASGEPTLTDLIQATLPLAGGPYAASAVARAVWRPVHDPYRHYDPRTAVEKSEASELFKDLQLLGEHGGSEGGLWVPLELFYCLARKENARAADRCDVAVFSVKTAPFLHTRLIKQWHNATNGLRQALQSGEPVEHSLSFAWNPRHLRRALRLMNQDELSGTFHSAAATARTSAYAEVATSAIDAALQIVSLSRQLGAVLSPQDVETVAVLLRASRALGHESLRYGSRMGLLLESTLQQRRMNRLLRQQDTPAATATNENEEEAEGKGPTASLGAEFFGLPGELRTMRTLQTRYTASTWAQPLREGMAGHKATAAAAGRYMAEVAAELDLASVPRRATTWEETGRRSHGDAAFENFESTLLTSEAPAKASV